MAFGVYIHFPYCRKRCPYCDFAIHARKSIPHERYRDAVLRELELRAPAFDGRRAVSLYFGGGTPGLWRADCVESVIEEVTNRFGAPSEITVEANPDDLPIDHLGQLRDAGVNRLSIGVQSLQPRHLHTLGRLHGADEAARAVADARAVGFDNLSLDLMFALPAETMGELERDLSGLVELEPEHLSVYNLTVEERTPFGAMKREGLLAFPEDGVAAEMYEIVIARLERAGYRHYEVSSFARPGREAVHNTLYWTGGEYLGLGSSASSHRRTPAGGERFSNVRSVDRYFVVEDPTAMHETLSPDALEREAVWLGLRLRRGVDRAAHARLHGQDPADKHAEEVEKLTREGLLEVTPERLRLTAKGLLFADEVGARFLA